MLHLRVCLPQRSRVLQLRPSAAKQIKKKKKEGTLNLRVKAWGAKGIGSQKVTCGRRANCCTAQGKSCPVGFSLLGGKGGASSGCSLRSLPILAFQKTSPFWLFACM